MIVLKLPKHIASNRYSTHYLRTFLSLYYPNVPLSKNSITKYCNELGMSFDLREKFFINRINKLPNNHIVAVDGMLRQDTSEVNDLSHYSFKSRIKGIKDISILYAFDVTSMEPLCSMVFPGNSIDVTSFNEFAWKEIIINAIAHRDYSIKGTDIQIKMFDDHITVESPGNLLGIVRLNNLRKVHFSRNPKIAEFLHQYEYVKEFGEGVDRLFDEMENAGLPDSEYSDNFFMLNATIRNIKLGDEVNGELNSTLLCLNKSELLVYQFNKKAPQYSRQEITKNLHISTRTIDRIIKSLIQKDLIVRKGSKKTGCWMVK